MTSHTPSFSLPFDPRTFFDLDPNAKTLVRRLCPMYETRRPAFQWWRGFRTMTHPAGYRPDEIAGPGSRAYALHRARACSVSARHRLGPEQFPTLGDLRVRHLRWP
jgi:hypothetical protein